MTKEEARKLLKEIPIDSGYSALVPFMIGPGERTISELWAESVMSNLLPPGEEEFVEGEIIG